MPGERVQDEHNCPIFTLLYGRHLMGRWQCRNGDSAMNILHDKHVNKTVPIVIPIKYRDMRQRTRDTGQINQASSIAFALLTE
eukprot:15364856-Ditylum_brightwellii.AAC.1